MTESLVTAPSSLAPRVPNIGERVAAVILFAGGVNALVQVTHFLPGWGNDPPLLSAEQFVCAIAGITAAVGAWRGRAWAWKGALLYGTLTAGLIASLGPLLKLDAVAQKGTLSGAAVVFAVCGLVAWYLRSATRRASAP